MYTISHEIHKYANKENIILIFNADTIEKSHKFNIRNILNEESTEMIDFYIDSLISEFNKHLCEINEKNIIDYMDNIVIKINNKYKEKYPELFI